MASALRRRILHVAEGLLSHPRRPVPGAGRAAPCCWGLA